MARYTQFEYFDREKAARFLAQFEGDFPIPKTAENHADRIAAQRRLEPVTTPEERAAVRAYNAERGR
jgi:hypothetical protein